MPRGGGPERVKVGLLVRDGKDTACAAQLEIDEDEDEDEDEGVWGGFGRNWGGRGSEYDVNVREGLERRRDEERCWCCRDVRKQGGCGACLQTVAARECVVPVDDHASTCR